VITRAIWDQTSVQSPAISRKKQKHPGGSNAVRMRANRSDRRQVVLRNAELRWKADVKIQLNQSNSS